MTRMNEEPHDSSQSPNATDRALMEYLDDILGETVPVKKSLAQPAKTRTDKVASLGIARPRSLIEAPVPQVKPESRTAQPLPFRPAEKSGILPALNLLELKIAPEPVKPPLEIVQPVPVVEIPVSEPAIATVTPAVDELHNTAIPPAEPPPADARPFWAQERFECLIFNVAGLKLAVPLITLGAIHKIDRKLNALPHQSDWFIGILQTPNAGNIKVLDTALCVLPERHDLAQRQTLAFVITIHGYPWGLACHQVEKSISLQPEQIKWRTERGKRPWLAGTVIDHMCALIDTAGFHDLIQQAEQSG